MSDGPDPDTDPGVAKYVATDHDPMCYMPLSGHRGAECFGGLDKARSDEKEKVLSKLRVHVRKWHDAQMAAADKEPNESISAYMYGAARALGDVLDLLEG